LTKRPNPRVRSKISQDFKWIWIALLKAHISPLNAKGFAGGISCYEQVKKVSRFVRVSAGTTGDESKRSSRA
jgi:hypothetical protein